MRILLVDDHTLFREALLHVLRQFDDAAVVIEAATAKEAIRLAAHYHDLDLILLDLGLPGLDGLCACPNCTRPARQYLWSFCLLRRKSRMSGGPWRQGRWAIFLNRLVAAK
ncbi:MAG: response regulator [Candidatus Competibacter sp.]